MAAAKQARCWASGRARASLRLPLEWCQAWGDVVREASGMCMKVCLRISCKPQDPLRSIYSLMT